MTDLVPCAQERARRAELAREMLSGGGGHRARVPGRCAVRKRRPICQGSDISPAAIDLASIPASLFEHAADKLPKKLMVMK